ncbi:heparinase II/III family protein [Sphingomicrobium sp. XHP0239]|uniref:heparinase II/III family protein n=1 Tax=Sphingomicrobium maritimum TaxID=3133972 RepID=UPI0031CC7831
MLSWLIGKGRRPLRLAAVPRDHVEGDRDIGAALMRGRLHHRGETLELKGLDFADHSLDRPIVRLLHSFAWLRDLAAATGREEGAKLGEAVARRWLMRHGDRPDAAWAPALLGERLLFWTAYAPFVLSGQDATYRRSMLNTMARGARHLEQEADKAAQGLPRITAWAGLTAASLTMDGKVPRVARCEAGLMRALAQGQHDDGGLKSRRPWEQALLVDRLGLTRAAYFAAKQSLPDALEEAAAAALAALHGVRHGDGGLASWQGGNPGDPQTLNAIVDGCGMRARPLRESRGWGYHRLSALGTTVQMDAAPPPEAPYASGAHASTLAIELSDGEQRLVMSCGGGADEPGRLPPILAAGLRGSAAHSTLIIAEADSSPITDTGTLQPVIREVPVDRREGDGKSAMSAEHMGYVRRFGLSHRRDVTLEDTGKLVTGADTLEPQGRRLRRPSRDFAIRFHLAPGIEASPTADGKGALLRPAQSPPWQFRCDGGTLGIEDSLVINAAGRPLKCLQLVIRAAAGKEGATVHWQFRRSS